MSAVALPEPGDDVLEPDEVLDAPLGEIEAKKLDTRLRSVVASAYDRLTVLNTAIEDAKRGQIHIALGFPSWTAYLVDRLAPVCEALPSDNRREVVMMLADAGMSYRAIGDATGTSKDTVARDLAVARQVSHDETPHGGGDQDRDDRTPEAPTPTAITGVDGKTYRAKPKAAPNSKGTRCEPFPVTFGKRVGAAHKAALSLAALADGERVNDGDPSRLGDSLDLLDAAITSLTEVRERFPTADDASKGSDMAVTRHNASNSAV